MVINHSRQSKVNKNVHVSWRSKYCTVRLCQNYVHWLNSIPGHRCPRDPFLLLFCLKDLRKENSLKCIYMFRWFTIWLCWPASSARQAAKPNLLPVRRPFLILVQIPFLTLFQEPSQTLTLTPSLFPLPMLWQYQGNSKLYNCFILWLLIFPFQLEWCVRVCVPLHQETKKCLCRRTWVWIPNAAWTRCTD